jgi:hypothetical protein
MYEKKPLSQETAEDIILWELAKLALKDGVLSGAESKAFMKKFHDL